MTRPIKFRVWDKKLKQMIPFYNHFNFDSDEYVFMQFTGIYDKNGKEIYEGDMVSNVERDYYLNPECTIEDLQKNWPGNVVEYCGSGYYLTILYDMMPLELAGFKKDYLEIIGNIFEHPDLIK